LQYTPESQLYIAISQFGLGILIPSAVLFLENGIRKAGNLFQDFLLGGAAGGRRLSITASGHKKSREPFSRSPAVWCR